MPIQKEDKKREEKRKRRGEERKIMNSYTQWFVFSPEVQKKKKYSCLARLGCRWGLVDLLVSAWVSLSFQSLPLDSGL